MMVSIWWVACAFVVGGLAGLVIFAFMSMASRQNEDAVKAEEALRYTRLGRVNLDENWTT